jgi:hypothetical protein
VIRETSITRLSGTLHHALAACRVTPSSAIMRGSKFLLRNSAIPGSSLGRTAEPDGRPRRRCTSNGITVRIVPLQGTGSIAKLRNFVKTAFRQVWLDKFQEARFSARLDGGEA